MSTVNVNGIRAAVKQRSETNLGFLPWLEGSGADVVALQEVRADEGQTRKALAPALDAEQMGETAVRLFLQLLKRGPAYSPPHLMLKPELVIRDSSLHRSRESRIA